MPALLISLGAQPLPLSLEASGYYDADGNWVEDYNYYDPAYDPSYSTGGYYDEFGNWISDGSGSGDTGSTGSSYDIWLSPSSEIDTDNDGISDYDEVYGYSIETESYDEVPYSYEEYDSETGEYVWRDSSYTSTTYNSIWVTTDPTDPDTDGDGLPDGWERLFSFHPNDLTDGYEDDDGDGLRNGLEYSLGTDLWNDDSDEDDLTDGEEVLLFGTDPMNPNDPGTSPLTNSGSGSGGGDSGGTGSGGTDSGTGGTDNGGTTTGGNGLTPDWLTWQGEHFADLLAANPDDPEATGDGDPDNDELTNIEEFLLGTDPRNPDTDGDDLLDGWEVAGLVLHFDRSETPTPTAAPLPGESGFSGLVYGPYQFQTSSTLYADDALSEIGVVETWTRTVETHDETWGITATTQETMERTGLYNAEGTLVFPDDGWIVNENGELVPNTPVTTGPPEPTWTQYFNDEMQMWVGTLTNGSTVSTWWWVHTDPLNDDSDGDDTPDGWEYENWFNPKKASDAAEDPDDDTLSNLLEYLNGTDPWLSDTDGDSLSDSHELNETLTDPLDPADPGEDSGGTAPIGGGITTVTRYQAFGGGGGSSGGGSGSGGSVLTMSGGGLLLGSQQSGLGNSLQPGNGGQKQTSQPVSEDELYFEVRRVFHRYDPRYESDGGGPGPDPGGAHDGHREEMTDPVRDEVTLVWVSTGGATTNVEPSEPEPEPDPSETPKYSSHSGMTIGGRYQFEVSEEYSSLPAVIGNIQNKTIPSATDWDTYARPVSSGAGAGFTTGQYPQGNRTASRGAGEHLEVRLARKTAPDGTHLAVEREVEKTFLKVFKHRPAPKKEADEWTIYKVEVVKLKIKKGDSTSVKDKENPVPDAVLKPEIVEGKVTGVELVPVEVDASFGYEWADSGRQRLNAKLDARAEYSKSEGTTTVYLIKGTNPGGAGEKSWVIRTSRDEKTLKEALSRSPYVVFEGHANMGLGPSFETGPIRQISDFTSFGPPYAALNMGYLNTGYMDNGRLNGGYYPNLRIQDAEIPSSVNNYTVVQSKINMERFPNNDGVSAGSAFSVQRYGLFWLEKFHFTRGSSNSKFIIAEAGSADLPSLGYKTFFYNSCNTARDFGEVFQHGKVFLSNLSCYPAGAATDDFVLGIIDGKSDIEILDAMNAGQLRFPTIDPGDISYRVVQY